MMLLRIFLSAVLFLLFAKASPSANATHSWGSYHWARTANPFTIQLGDNLNNSWDPYLATTSADWSVSSVLDTTIVAGGNQTNPKRCRPQSGKIEVCNAKYGNNGWLGLAQIWVSGSHINQATTKVNDTYFNNPPYNTPPWKNLVLCQEVGHGFGLDHQDEDFNNPPLGTCMDYTNDPTPNQHPNAHDYEQLEIIYAHLDTVATLKLTPFGSMFPGGLNLFKGDLEEKQDWGTLVRSTVRSAVFERDFGFGNKVFTFVIFAS